MKLTLTSTPDIVAMDGCLHRVWQGVTERGTKCVAFMHIIAVPEGEDSTEFAAELREALPPDHYSSHEEVLRRHART